LNGSIGGRPWLLSLAGRAGIGAKSGPESPVPEKGLITIAGDAENPQDGGARSAKTNLISAPFHPPKPGDHTAPNSRIPWKSRKIEGLPGAGQL
jgi:hypothetical protein